MFKTSDISPEKYRSSFSELDNTRTVQHNLALTGVGILNKLAEKNGLAPVYTGTISKEHPYRREVADAVMEYIEYIIRKRI